MQVSFAFVPYASEAEGIVQAVGMKILWMELTNGAFE